MSDLKDRLRALYKRMSLREKLLSLLFVLVILFLWSNNWLSRLSEWDAQRKLTGVELQTQQQWLDRSDLLTEQLAVALERVDPSKTFAAAQLSGHIDNLIRRIRIHTARRTPSQLDIRYDITSFDLQDPHL